MLEFGPDLGMPHTRAMSMGLFELRLKSREGLGRVFYCTLVGRKIVSSLRVHATKATFFTFPTAMSR